MTTLAIIGAGVAAVLLVGYLWRTHRAGGESEGRLSESWEGPNCDWRNSSEDQ